jgi:cysteinyl-tRNA synthetase
MTNSLTGKKEILACGTSNPVQLYVCGITPYDYAHVGHGRCYVTFDLFVRLLTFLGYTVNYCRNFTDIDDKLMQRAERELGDQLQYHVIAQRYIAAFREDLAQLNCISPNHEPLVTETIPEIIAFVEGLIAQGKAYVVDGDVYYSIQNFPEYGMLSKRKREDVLAGARVNISDKKRDPLDFALWKSEPEGMFWKSPWGYGRPGWHIECSAMAKKYLGTTIDIHGGGMDLIFPHHENEIAQSQGLHNAPFAKHWMHIAFVQFNKEKMSKSLGNFFTLRDVFTHFDPMVVRYYYLMHQYRNPLDFSFDDLEVAHKTYQRLARIFASIKPVHISATTGNSVITNMLKFLCDDLNTPGMLGVVFENLSAIEQDTTLAGQVKTVLTDILGLTLQPLPEKKVEITLEMQKLLLARDAARAAKDWAQADAIRDQLKALGYEAQDKKI